MKFRPDRCDQVDATHARLIDAAARIMQEERESSPMRALKVAARRLNLSTQRWPKQEAVRDSLRARMRMFETDSTSRVRRMQLAALEAMQQMQQFEPRAIGGIVDGALPIDSPIAIELLASHPDEVRMWLMQLKVPFEQRFYALEPRFEFRAGDFAYCLYVVCDLQKREPLGASPAQFLRQIELTAQLDKVQAYSSRTAEFGHKNDV